MRGGYVGLWVRWRRDVACVIPGDMRDTLRGGDVGGLTATRRALRGVFGLESGVGDPDSGAAGVLGRTGTGGGERTGGGGLVGGEGGAGVSTRNGAVSASVKPTGEGGGEGTGRTWR
jgi:hypothetical protein